MTTVLDGLPSVCASTSGCLMNPHSFSALLYTQTSPNTSAHLGSARSSHCSAMAPALYLVPLVSVWCGRLLQGVLTVR